MPIFEYNGKKYNVKDEHIDSFMKDFPDASTIMEHEGKKYRVKSADYNTFMSEHPQQAEQPATTSVTDASAQETPITEQDKNRMRTGVNQMMQRTRKTMEDFNEHVDNMREYRENNPLGETTAEGGMRFNADSGKMEKTYITPVGNRYNDKGLADMESFRYRQVADMSVSGQLRRANLKLAELKEKKAKSARRVHDEAVAEHEKNTAPLASLLFTGTYPARQMSDKENSALDVAIRQTEELIKDLEEQKDREQGVDVGFWRGFGRIAGDSRSWDFGMGDMRDAMTMMNADGLTGDNATDGERDAYNEMMGAIHGKQQAEQAYGDNASFWNRAGVMTGHMPSFMLDFALSGGGFEAINVLSKGGAKVASKAIGKEAAEQIAEQGFKTYVKNNGVKGFGQYAADWTIKALGTTADDLLLRAPLMTNTVQAGKTAADIIDRKLGDVVVNEDGTYDFSNDKTWGSAIWQGEANAIIENYSEMFGAHLDPVVTLGNLSKLANVVGAKRLGGVLAKADEGALSGVIGQTHELFNKMGVSDYFGEVTEEYYGQLWRTMLNLDDAYQQNPDGTRTNLLATGRFHGDIWGGMALSMGLMGAAKHSLSAVNYVSIKHGVNKADAHANELLGKEIWEPLKATLDLSTNENIGDIAETIVNDKDFTNEERAAVLDYMERSMMMRGFNLGTLAEKRGIVQDVDKQALNESFIDGYNIGTSQEMNDAKNMVDYQRQRVLSIIDEGTLFDMESDPIGALDYVRKSELWNDKESGTLIDYLNAKQVYDGMIQRVRDDIDGRIDQSNAMVDARTNRTTGMIQGATMKQDDRRVYVVAGNLVPYADGSGIDNSASDGSVIVRDAETGALEQVSPDAVLSIDEPLNPSDEKFIAAEGISQQFAQEAADKIDGIVTFNPGDTYTITGDDAQIQVQVVANEQGIVDNGDGTVNVSDGVNVFPMAKETIQQQVEAANMARIAQFEQQRAIENAEREQVMQEANRPQYALNDVVSLTDENGTTVRGHITADEDADGRYEVYTESPINGKRVNLFTRDELDGMLLEHNGVAFEREDTENAENYTQNSAENIRGNNGAENIPENGNNTPQNIPAMQRIPKDMQGNPIYEQADSDTAWDAIVEQTEGDEAMAQVVADDMVADKEAALKKLEKVKSKGGVSIQEKIAAEKERKGAIDAAKQELAIWKKIAGTANRRKMEADEERRRIAKEAEAIRKAEEEKLRAEREEAERIERESLNGVPDMVDDTPQDARARGYRRVNGYRIDRQRPIPMLQGKEVSVKFSDDVIVNGHVALIDASQLQPSHVQGSRNPLHFIDEAQPKERNDEASVLSSKKIAGNIRPEEITSSVTAYTGAPTVNARGEVIQGNNRSDALRLMWESHKDQAEQYKQYLKDHAEEFGLSADDIEATTYPVLVNMVDVDDAEAINLGQFVAQDTESGGMERIKAKNVLQKMGADMRSFANLLLKSKDEETSFAGLVDDNGIEVLKWMSQKGYITPTQYKSAFDSKGNLTAEAKNDLRDIMYQSIFKGGSTRLEEMFNALPSKAQKAILATAFRDYDSPSAERMIEEIQNSIRAYYALSHDKAFVEAKDFKEARIAVEGWKRQYQIDDATGESYLPAENFSNFALLLATMYRVENQSIIQGTFYKLYDLIQGTQEVNLFEQPDNTLRTLAQAIKETLNIDYNGQQRSNVLAGNRSASQGGQQGSNGDAATGERTEDGERTADRAGGIESNSLSRGSGTRVQETSEEVVEISSAERTEMETRIVDWLSEENLSRAVGKSREEIFDEFGNELMPIAYIPTEFISLVSPTLKDQRIYCGKGYFIDHALRNHAGAGMQASIEDVDVSKYLNIQTVLDNPDHIKETYVDGKRTVVFIKKIGRFFAELTQVEENGKVVLHKSFFNQKKEPYAKLNDIRQEDTSSEGGTSSISHTAEAAPAISLQSRGDVISNDDNSSNSDNKDTTNSRKSKELGEENLLAERISVQDDDWTEDGEYGETYKRTIIVDGIHHVTQVDEANNKGEYTGSYFVLDGKQFAGIPEVLAYVDDNGAVEKAQEVLDSIEQARKEVDPHPTDAQKEAGNYKMGHVKIDGFDITIENPKGSVRSGTDKNGKKWSITMNNDYGYIRGTEAVDGDHIDVFLSSFPTQGNVFVVDQANEDGSFDESKVMYGFSSLEEARAAYLSNYEEGWKSRIMAITEVSKDDFKKWIDSSHRKTKAFSEYKSVKKDDGRGLRQQLAKFKEGDVVRDYYDKKLYRIKKHSKNGVSTIAELDDEGNEVFETFMNAHNNARYSLAEAPTKEEKPTLSQESDQVGDQGNAPYTIEAAQYTTKKGKVLDMFLVKFNDELRKGVKSNASSYAKNMKGWWDRERGGFLMRSEEDAKRLAEYVSDAQAQEPVALEPVSMSDVKAVNDGELSFTEPQQPKEDDTQGYKPVWQYSVSVDKVTGRTTLYRDDVSGPIPIGDARFTVYADSPQEMLGILRNPKNGMQEMLDAVGVTLENKSKTMKMDKAIEEEPKQKEYHGGERVFSLKHNANKDILAAHHVNNHVEYTFTDGTKAYHDDVQDALPKTVDTRPNEGDMFKNHIAGGEAVAVISGVGEAGYVVSFASDLEDAQGGLFMGEKIVSNAEMQKWLIDGSFTPLGNDAKDNANPSGNKLVTDERYAELRERMRKKLGGQMNIGIDPEILAIGTEMAVYHIEKGAKKFAEYAKAMIADLGDAIRPYLKAFYNGARDLPEVDAAGLASEMTPYDEVQTFDVANFDKSVIDAMATAETVARETEVAQEVEIAQERIKKSRPSRKKNENKSVSSQKETGGLFGDLFAETDKVETSLQRKFAMTVKADMLSALDNDTKPYRSILDLRKRAKEIGMEVDDEGRTDILLQELVEDGLVRAAREVMERSGRTSKESYDLICKLYEMQPTIAARSSNRIKMQQYSTPLPMGWVADRFAMGGKADGNVLEPTAGNGMLVFGVPSNQVHANELDETRLENLREQGFAEVTQQDATEPFKGGMKYDAVIANPPFGKREAVEYDGKMIAGLDPQITLNALSSMKDDGRAAIIIGGNMEYSNNGAIKSMKPFFTYLYDHYNVKGIIDMSGGLYAKQGTTFPTRMILIDGRRSEEERAQTAVYPPVESKAIRKAESFEDLYEIINEVINSKDKTNGTEILRSRQGQLVSVTDRPSGNTDGTGHREQPRKNDDAGSGRKRSAESRTDGSEPVLPREHRANHGNGEARTEPATDNGGRSRSVSEPSVQRVGTERVSTHGVGLKQSSSEHQKRTLTDEKSAYRPHNSAFSLNSVAPSAMVEAMDKVLSQIEAEHGNIDEFVRSELGYDTIEEAHQALAAEQMDSVAMAIYQMKQGQALIIGDQTGVGKGRQMAALIRWAVQRGEKPVFITQKADLFSDIYRDLVDVGSGDLVPFIFNSDGAMVDSKGNTVHKPLSSSEMAKVFASGKLPDKYDFAVLTYSQVNTGDAISQKEMDDAAKSNGERSRKSKDVKNGKPTPKATFLRSIAEDNYLFLDESHTAAGSSNTGAYLQSILRGAKAATFASATFAKRPDTMPLYAIRTAMSQAKVEPSKMIGIIEKGGVTLQEIMSRELTNAGQMVRRERDMSDVVTDWKTITDPETVRRARDNYDSTIAAFNAIIKFQEEYVKPMIEVLDMELAVMAESAGVKRGTDKMGVENVPFASKTYNYTKQLMLALKVDAIADEVEAEINAGRHPVIALESTMESSIKDYAAGEVIEEPTFSASLLRGLDTVMQYTVKDENGKERHERYSPSQLGPVGEKAYYDLQDFIRESTSDIFISPLDAIIERLHEKGYKVGELTGRNMYVERDAEGRVVVKRRTDKDKKRMQREFNSGELDVLILNKSASTGISLHASEKFSDQRQRSMIIAQPLSDINDYMQMIGRIDRTGQVHRGYYINLGLPVPAENRFLMMLSTKLKSLNANTTTSQDSESNDVEAPDLLNKYGSQVVVEYLRDNVEIYEKMGTPLKKGGMGGGRLQSSELEDYKAQEDDARKITGYVALLTTKEQEDFYDDVVRRYNELIKYLNDTGSNDLKITVMPLRTQTLEKRVSSEGIDPNGNNPFARNSYVELVEMDVLRKPMKADEIRKVIGQINRGTDVDGYMKRVIDTVTKEDEARIAAEDERYEKAKAKAVEDIAKQTEKINAQTKRTEEEKRSAIDKFIAETNEKVEAKHKDNTARLYANREQMMHRLGIFEAGKSYLVPENLYSLVFDFATPAIFCGYKTKDSKITASTTLAVFATLDGRRRIEIKLSQIDALQSIERMTEDNWDAARSTTLDNWDSQIPSETRKTGYIMTGNILQAIADIQDERGSTPGQLISYTDMDGNIHDGILMPDKWNTSMLKSGGSPLSSRLQQIKAYQTVKSHDGKVELTGSSWAKTYYLSVPKTKKDGAVFFENKTLLSAAGGNFYPFHGKLRADIPAARIDEVVKVLTQLGVKVKDEKNDDDVMYRTETDYLGVLENAYRSNDKQLIQEAATSIREAVLNEEEISIGDLDWEKVEDYTGNDPKILAAQYIVRTQHDIYLDNDEDQEYMRTGIKSLVASEPSKDETDTRKYSVAYQNVQKALSKEFKKQVKERQAVHERGMWLWNGLMDEKQIADRYSSLKSAYEQSLEVMDYGKASDALGELRAFHKAFRRYIDEPIVEIPDTVSLPENFRFRKGDGALTADEVSMANDPVGKLLGKSSRSARERIEFTLRERKRMVHRVKDLAKKLGLDNVEIVTDASGLQGAKRKAKGFYSKSTGKITIVIPNHTSVFDAEQTLLHEAVAHYGLRQLFGEHFDTFLDNVYNHADEAVRRRIVDIAAKSGWDFRKATEEYLATLAENTDFENTNASWWSKIKHLFLQMLHKIGFEDFGGVTLTDNELRYILWRSYENLAEPGKYRSILGEAEDIAMQHQLKVGNYGDVATSTPLVAEDGSYTPERVIHEFEGMVANHPDIFAIRTEEDIDALPTDPFTKRDLKTKFRELRSTGVAVPADNLVVVFAERIDEAELRDTIAHESAHFASRNLKLEDFYKMSALSYLQNKNPKTYKHIVDGYPKEKWGEEAVAYLFEEKSKELGLERILNGKFDTHNDIGYIFYQITNYLNYGRKRNNPLRYGERPSEGIYTGGHGTSETKVAVGQVERGVQQRAEGSLSGNDGRGTDRELGSSSRTSVGNRHESGSQTEEVEDDVLYRSGDPEIHERALARDRYERRVKSGMFQSQEALQDSMLGLKEAMNAILGHGKNIEDVDGFENAYLGENRLSSVNKAEADAFAQTLFKPMLDEVAILAKNEAEREALTDYMMAKHGLERNYLMAENAAKDAVAAGDTRPFADILAGYREKDYAGLTALTGTDNVADAEAEARRMVDDYEQAHDTTNLWEKVNAVCKAILQKSYECGMMSKETFDKVSDMYEFYIPLRGFDETTSADAYAYLSHKQGSFNAPIKKAEGRKSKADDPFANLQSMAESAIMQGNRNKLVKQRFLNFALNHPSDLVSVSDLWVEYDAVADEWKPVFPDNIDSTDTPEEVERKMQDFQTKMEQLAQQYPDQYKRGRDAVNIPYRVVESRDMKQHQVVVKRNGRDYVVTINGNPRAAQALNGQTNPDNDMSGAIGAILRAGEKMNRQLSAFYTTRNPDFIVSNFMRDMLYTNSMTWIKESPNYALRFHRNYAKVNPVAMKRLLAKYRKGTLDMSDKTEAMFQQFMMNGGETGYANIRDIEQHKNDIRKELKRANGKLKIGKALNLLAERFDELNRAVENCARFAAFITSREMGRSIDRAIYDAKEISVNFNKKGSGAKFFDSTGQTKAGNASALVSGLGRSGYVFWNAAIQGTTNFGRQVKRHPAKALTGAALMFLLGAIVAYLGGDDDEDDKNAYYNLPDYVRRCNILFRAGDSWISIPLPIEYRAFYGMGELMTSVLSRKEHLNGGEIAEAIAGQATQILPIDFLEGGGGLNAFVPSAAKPLWEAYVAEKSWTGLPLYKDTNWNKEMPEWTKAYKNANKYIVNLAAVLNEATGGDAYTKGAIDINPSKLEYMLNGYFSGVSGTIDKFMKTAETLMGDREYDPRNFLLVNRLVKAGDERTEYRAVNNEYFRLKKEHDQLESRLKHYEEDTDNGIFDYAEKIDFLYNSPEYARYEIFEEYRKDIDALYNELSDAMNDEDRKEIEAELNALKKEMIEEMNLTRK